MFDFLFVSIVVETRNLRCSRGTILWVFSQDRIFYLVLCCVMGQGLLCQSVSRYYYYLLLVFIPCDETDCLTVFCVETFMGALEILNR